jgi:transposase-like protein
LFEGVKYMNDWRSKSRRRYDRDFKIEIANTIANGDATPEEVSKEYSISRSAIDRWTKEFSSDRSETTIELERENEKLRAKIGELVMIIDQLKKNQPLQKQKKQEPKPEPEKEEL